MKKALFALLAIPAVLVGAGCTPEELDTGSSPAPTAVETHRPATSNAPGDTVFLKSLELEGIEHPAGPDYLTVLGETVVCGALENTPESELSPAFVIGMAIALAEEFPTDEGTAAYIVGAAVGSYCPKFAYLIEGE